MPPTPKARRQPPGRSQAPPKGKKSNRRRVYIAVGVIGLAIVAYLWYRSRSANQASSAFTPSSGATGQTPTDSGTGGGASGGTPPSDNLSGILSSLAGENQSLLNSLLASQQGLMSLAGSSLGSPNPNTGSSQVAPQTIDVFVPSSAPGTTTPSTPQGTQPPGPTPAAEAQQAAVAQSVQRSSGGQQIGGTVGSVAGSSPSAAAEVSAGAFSGGPPPAETSVYAPVVSRPEPVRVAANPSGATKTKSQGIITIH